MSNLGHLECDILHKHDEVLQIKIFDLQYLLLHTNMA